jgi:V/A-type H+-transporting ATPase subunit E
MVSADYTLDKVSSEALNEILTELGSGKSDASELVHSLLRQTRAEVAKILQDGERQSESVRRQILGSAELEARNGILRTLEEASNRIFRESLLAVPRSPRYEKTLTKLISEGLEVIGKEAVVSCNARDRKAIGSAIREMNSKAGAKLILDEKSIDVKGGVVLRSKDGTMRFDNTLEARLERIKPQLRRDVVATISGSEKQ